MVAACKRCKSKDLIIDDVTTNTVCTSCGVVQDCGNFFDVFGGVTGPTGTFVKLGTAGTGTQYSYIERKLNESSRVIEDITFRLGFGDIRAREVKAMVEKVTDGEFGLGNWFSVLVGACCYIVMRLESNNTTKSGGGSRRRSRNDEFGNSSRMSKVPLLIDEVAEVAGSEVHEMGKMVRRVVEFLGLELGEFDLVGFLEKTIRGYSGFSEVDKEKVEVMVKQGNFVMQCAIKWFLTTGRRPGPMVVAVLVFVGTVNGVRVRIEEVANEVNVAVPTCKLRYKELLEALVEVAKKGLPWGKDVNVKNIVKNGLFVLKYMEMKSMEDEGRKKRRVEDESDMEDIYGECLSGGLGDETDCNESKKWNFANGEFDFDDLFGDCLTKDTAYVSEGDGSSVENGSQCLDDARGQDGEDLKDRKISHEDLDKLYSKFKADVGNRQLVNQTEVNKYGFGQNDLDLQIFDEWWSGRSEMCEKLFLDQLEEKDVGLDTLPPSYIRGCLVVKRRREKIKAAKMRINSIICPSAGVSNDGTVSSLDAMDWEDFIIETLLLHHVKEEEIEKGYYKALLGLHVFKSGIV